MNNQIIGSIGIGLVWGWLVGTLEGRVKRSLRGTIGAVASTLAVAVTVYGFEAWRGLVGFLIAAAVALLIHLSWRRSMLAGLNKTVSR
jgi:hypothetical protein